MEKFLPDADVDRVQPLGPVQREATHAAVVFDQQVTEIHACSPGSPAKTGAFRYLPYVSPYVLGIPYKRPLRPLPHPSTTSTGWTLNCGA